MMSITPFDIVLVPFPFTTLTTLKKRPALVLTVCQPEKLSRYVVVAMITSQREGISFPYDVDVKDWEAAHLLKPSLVRLSKMVSLEETMIQKTIGNLTQKDQLSIQKAFSHLFDTLLCRLQI